MQTGDAGNKSTPRKEDNINFRPSPNFKHMKKYLKSKFEEMNASEDKNNQETQPVNTKNVPANVTNNKNEPGPSNSAPKQDTASATTVSQPSTIQPPLPPNPPPDTPLCEIKQEVIDTDYEYPRAQNALEQLITEYKSDPPDHDQEQDQDQPPLPPESGPTMCRNYIRGTCKKGPACIFTHELIISQLPGVYTFCRNFQNRQCTRPKCNFVHATVFEKEHFYRTGYLPPHTLAHLKQPSPTPNATVTSLNPPEEPPSQEIPPAYYCMDMNSGMDMTTMSGLANYMMQAQMQSMNDMYAGTSQMQHLKRNWNEAFGAENINFNPFVRDLMPKKCKDCDTNEFRYQYHRNKLENMMTASEEMNKKMAHLNAKTERLCTVLSTLFKPQSGLSNFGLVPPIFGGKEKNFMDPMQFFTPTHNRMSFMNEEMSMRNMFGSNMNFQNLLAKMFMNSSDQLPM